MTIPAYPDTGGQWIEYYDPFANSEPVTDPPSCSLWVNGSRFADGQPGEDPLVPAVLTNLKVVWGRPNALDQPAPSTATFNVQDLAGGQTFLDVLHMGARVDVRTDATIYPDPTISMLPYGDFENGIGYSYSANLGLRTVGSGTAPVLDSIIGPGQVSTISQTLNFPATVQAGDWLYVGYQSTLGTTAPTFLEAGWEIVKAMNAGGNCRWLLARRKATASGAQSITITQTAAAAATLIGFATRGHGAVVVGPITEGGSTLPPTIAGVALPGPGMRVTIIAGRVTSGTARPTVTAGATTVASPPMTGGSSALPWVITRDRVDAAGPAIPVSVSWPAAATPGGGGITLYFPDVPGNSRLQILGANGVQTGSVIFPPAAFSSDPSAWNAIPRSKPGQTWRAGATIYTYSDLGTTVQTTALKAVYFRNPNGSGMTNGPYLEEVTSARPGGVTVGPLDWQPPDDVWVGLALDINPLGPRWRDLDGRSWDSLGAAPSWWNLGIVEIDDLELLAPEDGVAVAGLVFSGLITDLDASYSLDMGGTLVKVIAQDWTADLANRYVGDQPWNLEPLGDRFARIVWLTGQQTTYEVDPGPAALHVSYRDVDTQQSLNLLQELARTSGGALWSATNLVTGPYLWLEDVDARLPLKELEEDEGGIVRIVDADLEGMGAITLSACSVALEPVHWIQASDDDGTRVVVNWLEQTTDNEGKLKPTQRTQTAIDTTAEAETGVRRVQVSTQLVSVNDASSLAGRMLARLRTPGWRVTGLTIRLDPFERLNADALVKVMRLLDGTTRIGQAILLTDLPEWSPVANGATELALYLEGGRLTSLDGYWTIELVTSDGGNIGNSARWQELDAGWLWQEFDPAIYWYSLSGVGA